MEMSKKKIFASIVAFYLLLLLNTVLSCAQSNTEGYTHYGYVPARIWFAAPTQYGHGAIIGENFTIDQLTIARSALLGVVAYAEGTKVKVYTLPDKTLIKDGTIDEMGKLFVKLPNGTFFKVCTDKPVTVELLGGNVGGEELDSSMKQTPLIDGFYPAVDRGYTGKEFIFIAAQGLTGLPYRILALEDAEITVYKEDGNTATSFTLNANEYKDLSLSAFKAYTVVSTGNIMIQSFSLLRSMCIPSVEGRYTGTSFYTMAVPRSYETVTYGFQISAAEETKVTVYDVEFKREIDQFTVPTKSNITTNPQSQEIFIQSEKLVSVAFVHHGLKGPGETVSGTGLPYGAGLTYLGVSPGETAHVYVPLSTSQESYVFAYKNGTVVTINGAPINLDADQFIPLAGGLHEIKATENVLIQVVHWPVSPDIQAISSFGAIVPAIETLDIRKTVELQPILEEETAVTPYIYIAAAVAIVAVAAAIYYLRFKR